MVAARVVPRPNRIFGALDGAGMAGVGDPSRIGPTGPMVESRLTFDPDFEFTDRGEVVQQESQRQRRFARKREARGETPLNLIFMHTSQPQ